MLLYSVTTNYTVVASGSERTYTDVVIAENHIAAREWAVETYGGSVNRDDYHYTVQPFVGVLPAFRLASLSEDADGAPVFVLR